MSLTTSTANDVHQFLGSSGWDKKIEFFLGVLVVAVMVIMLLFGSRIMSTVFKVRFNSNKKYSDNNILWAYIYLAVEMVKADGVDAAEKQQYIKVYTKKYFPKLDKDIRFDFNYAFENKVPTKEITAWLRAKADRNARLQLMYFLAGISVVDGSMNRREIGLLRKLCHELDLTQKDFDSIIAMYAQRRRRTQSKSQSKTNSKSSSSRTHTTKSALKLSCEVLGVSEHASMDEIKKAYRKMVKLHHPDRFATCSEQEQRIAQERFIEIQAAYETIEKLK